MPGTEIPTDLLTPLGAYLALREGAGGAFLLESVERGRLGRYSFVGAGSRLVSFAEAETLGEPVVGYLGYDAVASFEPTVPLPEDGPAWRRASSSSRTSCSASTTRAASPSCCAGRRPSALRRLCPAGQPRVAHSSASRRATSTSAASSARRSTSARATSSR